MGIKKKAVIFDMDGVISDTQKIHAELEELLLGEQGIKISAEELTRKYAGVPDRECAEMIFKEYGKKVDLNKFIDEKWARIMKFARGRISAVDGALDLIEALKENNFKLAVASSSPSEFIDLVLSELGVKDKFDVLTNGHDVKLGKPHPDIFILTAERLGISPSDSVVIEDGRAGVEAAKKAGMKCIWLANDSSDKSDCPADIVVKSLRELSLDDFS